MKKIYLLSITIISLHATIISLKVSAQNNFVGAHAGVNRIKYKGVLQTPLNATPDMSARYGLNGGLTFETFLNNYFTLGVEILYEQTGFRFEAEIDEQLGTPYTITNKYSFHQLALPVTLGVNFGKTWYGNVHLGIVPALVLDARRVETSTNPNSYIAPSDLMHQRKFGIIDAGFLFGGIIGYKLNSRSKLYSMIRYRGNFYYPIEDYYTVRDGYKYRGASFSVGYAYALSPPKPISILPVNTESNLARSKHQRISGYVLMGTGLVTGIAGLVIQQEHDNSAEGFDFDFSGATIAVAGGAMLGTGIVLYIVSDGTKNKTR